MAEKAETSFGKIDVLINNAAIFSKIKVSTVPFDELDIADWDRMMAVNLKGPFWGVKYSVPFIIKSGGGSVINVSSIMGMLGGPATAYNTSKGALRQLTKCDAVVYAKDNIRFNSVHPGYIITPTFKRLASKTDSVEESIEREGKSIPLGRMGMPEEIANGILFLASDESSYVTGAELVIDGGKLIV